MHPGHTSISGLVSLETSQLLPRSRSPGAQIHKLEAQVERGDLKMHKAPWLFGPTQLEDIMTLLSLASWLLSLVAWPGSCWDTGAPLAWVSLSPLYFSSLLMKGMSSQPQRSPWTLAAAEGERSRAVQRQAALVPFPLL